MVTSSRTPLARLRAAFGLALSLLLSVASAAAEPKDADATRLGKEAMDGDYLAMRFKQAEQKLKSALGTCGKKNCSAQVRARLHADLAVVYIVGLKKKDKGKKELKDALSANPAVQLSPDFSTPEVEKAYEAAGGVKEEVESQDDDGEAEDEAEDEAARRAAATEAVPRNWFSLSFQQEFLIYDATKGVCTGGEQYECFRGVVSLQGTVYGAAGNELNTGFGLATRRVLLGYERLLLGKISAGGRLGFAFGGRPNATIGIHPGFMPLHAEVRGSYWFGQAPFERKGVRFFAGLSAGFGEVNGKATVYVYASEADYMTGNFRQVDAWRKTGSAFVSAHGGVAYAFHQSHALALEIRILQMLGKSALGAAANLGYSLGL